MTICDPTSSACEMCGWDPTRTVAGHWLIVSPRYNGSDFKIITSGIIASGNTIGSNEPSNYRYRKAREVFAADLKEQLNNIPRAERFREGVITRWYNTRVGRKGSTKGFRAYDDENLRHGCKPLIDTLRSYGVLVNDSPSWWRGHYKQEAIRDGGSYYTIELLEYA